MGFLDKVNEKISEVKEKVTKLMEGRPKFDPATLNDEVAMMTEWGPAKGGGTSFGSHSLRVVSSGRLEFKAQGMALLFPAFLMVLGIAVSVGMSISGINKDIKTLYLGIPLGTVFFLIGFFLLRSFTTPRVFDLDVGYYWRGRKSPNMNSSTNEQCQLKDIHAIQLLKEYCSGSKGSSFYSYELNLVLKDGSRMNVVDHGKLSLIQDDAEKLSQFLNVPVWDAISQ